MAKRSDETIAREWEACHAKSALWQEVDRRKKQRSILAKLCFWRR